MLNLNVYCLAEFIPIWQITSKYAICESSGQQLDTVREISRPTYLLKAQQLISRNVTRNYISQKYC